MSRFTVSVLMVFASYTILGTVSAQSPIIPGKLAIYYGYPSLVNGSGGDPVAATETFKDYDIVVFGDGLQSPSHPDHSKTLTIIGNLDTPPNNTSVYGYITIGVTTVNLPMEEIQSRVDDWKAMGAAGIFLDQAGYDYGVTRQRQNEVLDYIHYQGLSAFINAWNPDDVFSPAAHAVYNPTGDPTSLDDRDIYLHESFQIIMSDFQDAAAWVEKSDKAMIYKDEYGTRMATATTVSPDDPEFHQSKLDYAWYSTLLYGFDFMAWGELYFSATDNTLPFHARPDPGEIGNSFVSLLVDHSGDIHTRATGKGIIEVNTLDHIGKFTRNAADGIYVWTDETSTQQDRQALVNVCTNPSNPLGIVLLSNYKSGGYLGMWPAENLHAFNTLAHQSDLSVYALYTNKDWIGELLQYNAECGDVSQRFDGYAMDFEGQWPSGGAEPTGANDIQYYADAKAACGILPLHVSIGWRWDNTFTYGEQKKPAYEHIFDLVNSVDVQTAFETAEQIVFRSKEEVSYAAQINKPVFPTIETQDVTGIPGYYEWNTFYEEGEQVMWCELAKVQYNPPGTYTGFILHYYKNAYSSGEEKWPLKSEMNFIEIPLKAGWNMISVPGDPEITAVPYLVEGIPVLPYFYTWDPQLGGYIIVDTIQFCECYWVAAIEDCTLVIYYTPRCRVERIIYSGWNMVCSPDCVFPVDSIVSDPPCHLPYVYTWDPFSGGYVTVTELISGGGYWMGATCDSLLIIDCSDVLLVGHGPGSEDMDLTGETWKSIISVECQDRTQELVFGMHPSASDGFDRLIDKPLLPPVPVAALYDGRENGDGKLRGILEAAWLIDDPNFPMLCESYVKDRYLGIWQLSVALPKPGKIRWSDLPDGYHSTLHYGKRSIDMNARKFLPLPAGEHNLTLVLDGRL